MILLYHKVDSSWEIHPSRMDPILFEKQMRELYKRNITLVPLVEYIKSDKGDQAALTFDDGYQNIYRFAWPILKKIGFRATVYIPTDFIGKENDWDVNIGGKKYPHLNEGELKELSDSGWEIASHGKDHKSFLTLTDDELEEQLIQSKKKIEEITGRKVFGISYPFGHYNGKIIEKVRRHYAYACAVVGKNTSRFDLSRTPVYGFERQWVFKRKLNGNCISRSFFYCWERICFLFTFGSVIVRKIKT